VSPRWYFMVVLRENVNETTISAKQGRSFLYICLVNNITGWLNQLGNVGFVSSRLGNDHGKPCEKLHNCTGWYYHKMASKSNEGVEAWLVKVVVKFNRHF